jgi:hypothetical protein
MTRPTSPHGDEFDNQLLDLLKRGQKIEAIKQYRERSGAGLKEAKDAVEALAAQHGLATPQIQGPGCLLVFAVLLAMAIVGIIVVLIMR